MNNTIKKIGIAASSAGLSLLPFVAYAQSYPGSGNTGGLQLAIYRFQLLINQLIPVLLVMAVFWFLWGVMLYIMSDLDDRQKGITIMIHGIVALFVMTTVWGLVGFVGDTVGIRSAPTPTNLPVVLPTTPTTFIPQQ